MVANSGTTNRTNNLEMMKSLFEGMSAGTGEFLTTQEAKLDLSIEKRGGEQNALADTAASFGWDGSLSKAVTAAHKHTGYGEEHKKLYLNDMDIYEEDEDE